LLSNDRLLLAVNELAKRGQRPPVLLLLSHVAQPAALATIKEKGIEIGFKPIGKWNVSEILARAAKDGQVAPLPEGWKITLTGLDVIADHYRPEAAIVAEARHSLRAHLQNVGDPQRRAFLEEAVLAFDARAYRAAVVLAWVGAMHIVQEHIVANHLSAFNAAGMARAAKANSNGGKYVFVPVRSVKDFGIVGEADVLQIAQDAGILHKAEKQTLNERLDLRNQCGHPNPLTIGEHTVAHHLEILMLNVYSKY
jgi:hypothetical protein